MWLILTNLSINLKILGCNAAIPAHNRHQTSQFLTMMQHNFLIDCGEGTQLQLKKYKVKANRIDHIFISHLHGDHYYGLIGLISSMHLYGRKKELYLFGPPGLAEIITLQLKHSDTSLNYKVIFKEWKPNSSELLFENNQLTVHSFPLNHRVNCSGFLFKEKPKSRRINKNKLPVEITPLQILKLKTGEDVLSDSGKVLYKNSVYTSKAYRSLTYAYCSDTKYDERILPYIDNADLLYHEATFMADMEKRASLTFHTTTIQAGEIATKANVSRLIIGHYSTRYKDVEPMLAETQSVFPNTELAIEGKLYAIEDS